MQDLPEEIYPLAAVRDIDRAAVEVEGIPGYTLMTRAGNAAVAEAIARFPAAERWQVVCGAGNNAGDGYVVARLAAALGRVVSAVALVDPETLGGDAATAYEDFVAEGGTAIAWNGELDADASLLVDGLLGSGLARPVAGVFADAVAAINAHPAATLALDIPTGLHGDSGDVLGAAVVADMTVTFVALKSGLFRGDAPAHTGEIRLASLDIPPCCYDNSAVSLHRITTERLRRCLPKRPRQAHKGDFGQVLVVGGGAGMPGAVRLCGEAALRSGAGRVSLATDPAHAAAIVAACPELMSYGVANKNDLKPLLQDADVVAFGPGLGTSNWAQALYELAAADDTVAVWDADALNLLAKNGGSNEKRVITPHPGEAARLLDTTSQGVQANRSEALQALRERYGGTVVLKGAGTLVSAGDGATFICTSGNPGMAAPGMGDVLTGIIAALIAQGQTPQDAALVAVEVHARAGDLAAWQGERGMTASDLLAEIRGVLNPQPG